MPQSKENAHLVGMALLGHDFADRAHIDQPPSRLYELRGKALFLLFM
jgi:hypothetical protein